MICEPWIYTVGPKAGQITWHDAAGGVANAVLYANFEREKLIAMKAQDIHLEADGYILYTPQKKYSSGKLIGYYCGNHSEDSESSRLLQRAEFLKAVCEKEGVSWLPKEKSFRDPCSCVSCKPPTTEEKNHGCDKCNVNDGRIRIHSYPCTCQCHKPTEERAGECECETVCGGCGACKHRGPRWFCFCDHSRFDYKPTPTQEGKGECEHEGGRFRIGKSEMTPCLHCAADALTKKKQPDTYSRKEIDDMFRMLCALRLSESEAEEKLFRKALLDTIETELNTRALAPKNKRMTPSNIMLGSIEELRRKYL